MKTISASTAIEATPERVWEVIADFGGISASAPHLTGSRLTTDGDVGVGSARHCDLSMGGMSTEETITRWDEGRGYSVDVVMAGSPMPVKSGRADFDIHIVDGVTRLTGSFSYEMGWGPLGGLLEAVSARRFVPMWSGMLAGFKARAETGAVVGADTQLPLEAVTAG